MNKPILYCLAALCLLAACKKDTKVTPMPPVKTTDAVFPTDSVSITIDGKTYALARAGSLISGNTQANRKIDSFVNYSNYHVSGDKDSTFFYETYRFNAPGMGLDLSFFKKYATADMVRGIIYYPNNQTDLFEPGNYQYGTDFNRENATNGVGLAVNSTWQTYSDQALVVPVTISPDSEKNAHFQILSLKKLAEDDLETQYVLEAKFDATLFDDNGATKPLTDGYIRMNIAVGK